MDTRLESPTKIHKIYVPAGQWIPACAGMTKSVRMGSDVGMTKRERVCVRDNVLDVPAGQWIPACAGMTKNEDGARCAGMTRV